MPGTSLSGATQTFDSQYADNPWAGLDRNQRQWFDPILQPIYRQKNVFGQFTTFEQNNGAVHARTMTLNGLYDLHENTDPLGDRELWLPAAHVDSWQVDVTFSRQGNKVAYHKFDRIINYWKTTGNMNYDTLKAISNDKLGINIAGTLDKLSRNAYLQLPYAHYGPDLDGASFNDITPDQTVRTGMFEEIHLGMMNRDLPYASDPNGNIGTVVCITSPGVWFDIRRQGDPADFLYRSAYARPSALFNFELGQFQNMRFVISPKCQLWNCGQITIQTTVTAPIAAGDGAPSAKVDNTKRAGQSGATHYIQLDSGTDMSKFAKDDIVTVHVLRTSAYGISNGVDYTDGVIQNMVIESVNSGAHQISFKKPIMEPFTTDLGGGVYGYVTKGVHVHASIFIGAPNAICVGIGSPLELNYPDPVDDFKSIYRVSWEINAGWQTYNPDAAEVVFTAGSVRLNGGMLQ